MPLEPFGKTILLCGETSAGGVLAEITPPRDGHGASSRSRPVPGITREFVAQHVSAKRTDCPRAADLSHRAPVPGQSPTRPAENL